jgi:23S rRNA (uracil1939-C5)-methyltransferase
LNLTIEKLVYGGEGLARVPDESGRSKTVFVPFVLPTEEVSASIIEQKRSFAHARLENVVHASPLRAVPPCPYFQRCGGCHYQHMDYPQQLATKQAILRETLQRTAKLDWDREITVHSAEPLHYRNRTRMRVNPGEVFAMGYYEFRSHRLLPVRECPISSPLINRALAAMWSLGERGLIPELIQEVEFFAGSDDCEMMVELYVRPVTAAEVNDALGPFAACMQSEFPAIKGVSAFSQKPGDPFPFDKPIWSFGSTSLDYKIEAATYRVSAGSFFQTNRFLSDRLVGLVTENKRGSFALDLYAGTGLFSIPLAKLFARVVAVEGSPASFADLRANATANVESVRKSTEDYLQTAPGPVPDFVVVDPPRAGLGEQTAKKLARLSPAEICYVSCDPSTLSRDLRVLIESGYRVSSIELVDLFPQTYHLETIVHLAR